MITLPDREAQGRVLAALSSGNPAAETGWEFSVGGRVMDPRVESLSYGREEGSVAMALDAEIVGALDPKMRGGDAFVDVIVAGVPVRRFTGRAHRPKSAVPVSTLLANTSGHKAGRNWIGRKKTFAGYSPRLAAVETLLSLGYRGAVEVEEHPKGEWEREQPFLKREKRQQILDALKEECGYVFRDTRLDGVRATRPRPAPLSAAAVWTFRVGRDCAPGAFTYDPAVEEYRYVYAYRLRDDGEDEDLTDLAEVPGQEDTDEDAVYPVEIPDSTPAAYSEGKRAVNEMVTALRHGETNWKLELPWIHVLLEEGDVVVIEEPTDDETHLVLRTWLGRVDLIAPEDPSSLTQTLSGKATYRETRVPKALVSPAVPSLGVLEWPAQKPAPPNAAAAGNTAGELSGTTGGELADTTAGELSG